MTDVLLSDVVQRRALNSEEARGLVDSIRADVADLSERITTAYLGRAWLALGYPNWDTLCEAEFDGARLRVPREQRAEQVQSLAAAGLSVRAIASVTGVSVGTVHGDLAGVQDRTPAAPRVGQDGKTYAPTQPPRTTPPPATPTRPALAHGEAPAMTGGGVHVTTTKTVEEFVADRVTGEVLSVEDWQAREVNPLAAARAEVAKQPAMLAGRAFDRLHSARLLLTEAGTAAAIVADLAHDGLADGDQGDDWLPELDALLPLLTDLASALRRRNLRSVRP